MAEQNDSKLSNRLEYFKVFSTFFSSVVIALTGIFLTNEYNSQQLEIAQQQAKSQLELARLQEISKLIPKLGSSDNNERRFGAIALGLYGDVAVPALLALLSDPSPEVRQAGVESLSVIGKVAIPQLVEALGNRRNPTNLRAGAIYTLGQMQAESAFDLAIDALNNPGEDPVIRKDAATAIGFLKDQRGVPVLLERLEESKETDVDLAKSIVWSLGQIADRRATRVLAALLSHSSEELRVGATWALAECSPAEAESILSDVAMNDQSIKVREAAETAIKHAKRRTALRSRSN